MQSNQSPAAPFDAQTAPSDSLAAPSHSLAALSHCLAAVSDHDLLRRLAAVLAGSRHTEADLAACIGEVDARRLYLGQAAPSMFAFCTERLHLSEAEACLRIAAARASREHPVLLEMLGDGRLHLGGIAKLAPHLTQENRDAVLGRAVHKSNRQIEELVAELAPRPDVPATIRKLPAGRVAARPAPAGRIDLAGLGTDPRVGAADLSPAPGVRVADLSPAPDVRAAGLRTDPGLRAAGLGTDPIVGAEDLSPDPGVTPDGGPPGLFSSGSFPSSGQAGSPSERAPLPPDRAPLPEWVNSEGSAGLEEPGRRIGEGPSLPLPEEESRTGLPWLAAPPPRPARIEPLAPSRYKVQFTASAELRDKLERLKALMRSSVPDGDLAAVIEAAVTEKLERMEARRFGTTDSPRKTVETSDTSGKTRAVPAAVRRVVHEREAGRCVFVDGDGNRCTAQAGLEFHHRKPFAMGGDHSTGLVSLLCGPHNRHLGRIDFGTKAIGGERRAKTASSTR